MYQQQLHAGADYASLKPTISICFVNSILFPEIAAYHLPFQLRTPNHAVVLTDDLAIHLMELPKFKKTVAELTEPLDIWLYFCVMRKPWTRTSCRPPWTFLFFTRQWRN